MWENLAWGQSGVGQLSMDSPAWTVSVVQSSLVQLVWDSLVWVQQSQPGTVGGGHGFPRGAPRL